MSGTRRDFLRRVAQAGGYRATYLSMQAMGLLGTAAVAEPLALEPGTFAFFEGRQSIHRVAPIGGPTDRYIGLLGFDTKPDTNSSEALKMRRYGRVA